GMVVNIYRYPSLPLVDTLGLRNDFYVPPAKEGRAVADILQPDDPFRVELSIKISLADVISHTAGALPWLSIHPPDKQEPGRSGGSPCKDLQGLMSSGPQPLIRSFLDRSAGLRFRAGGPEKGAIREVEDRGDATPGPPDAL